MLHGREDEIVPVGQVEVYAEAARPAGDPVELLLMDGVGHGNAWGDPGSPVWWAARSAIPGRAGL